MLLAITTEGKIGLGVVAAVFIVFALLSSFWFPRRDPGFPGSRLGLFSLATAVLFVATVAAVVVFAKEEEEGGRGAEAAETRGTGTGEGETSGETTGEEAGAEGDAAAGESVFSQNCAACHTLEAAGASGTVGPNLDESQPDAGLVEDRVRNGSGAMPAFEGELSDEQIEDVTAFVVESTRG